MSKNPKVTHYVNCYTNNIIQKLMTDIRSGRKLETEEPEKRKQEEAIDELTRINSKIVSMSSIHKSARRYSAISIFLYTHRSNKPASLAGPSRVIIFLSR